MTGSARLGSRTRADNRGGHLGACPHGAMVGTIVGWWLNVGGRKVLVFTHWVTESRSH